MELSDQERQLIEILRAGRTAVNTSMSGPQARRERWEQWELELDHELGAQMRKHEAQVRQACKQGQPRPMHQEWLARRTGARRKW